MTDDQLKDLGVTRSRDAYGIIYSIPCAVCGRPIRNRRFSTKLAYKCKLCKSDAVRTRNMANRIEKEKHERALAALTGIDYVHTRRFESAASKFDDSYAKSIELARTVADRFDSIPEVVACIELLQIGAKVIAHQRVGDFTVDFCLPNDKLVVEIDGNIYHADEDKEYMRDYAIKHMLGEGWEIRHIPADAVAKNHEAFGRTMKRMLAKRRKQ